jgi:hypothetical protein
MYMQMDSLLGMGIGPLELVVIFFGGILTILVQVIPFWKICTRAGFPGPLSLLMILPLVNIIFPFYIAFSEWPVMREKVES